MDSVLSVKESRNSTDLSTLLTARDHSELSEILGEYLSADVLGDKRAADFDALFEKEVGGPFFAHSAQKYEKELFDIFKQGF